MNISPIKGRYVPEIDSKAILDSAKAGPSYEPELFIDGLVIHGHRLFGLPPTEPTYFCKWDFDIGKVLINGEFEVIQSLGRVGRALSYTFRDSENSLILPVPILYDVLYLSLKVDSVKVQLHTSTTTLEVLTSDIGLSLNDLNNDRYSSRMSLKIPWIHTALFGNFRKQDSSESQSLAAAFKTSVAITNFVQKRDFEVTHEQQQEHIALHDGPFQRCPFLLDSNHRAEYDRKAEGIEPSISLPGVPAPLTSETVSLIDPGLSTRMMYDDGSSTSSSSASSKSQRAESSFLPSVAGSSVSSLHTASSKRAPSWHPDSLTPLHTAENKCSSIDSGVQSGEYFSDSMFLPPESWDTTGSSGTKHHLPFRLHPTTHYSVQEAICPRTRLDPDYEYDNVIVQFGPVEGHMGPYAIGAISSIIETAQHQDIGSTMDALQVDVLNKIRYINYGKPEVKNVRIMVPNINVKYGALHEVYPNVDCTTHPPFIENDQSHLYLDCQDINIVLRQTHPKRPQTLGEYMQNTEEVPTWTTVYLDVENIALGLRRGQSDCPTADVVEGEAATFQDYTPLFFQIDQTEFWWNEEGSNVGSLRIKSIDSSIMSDHVKWAASFLDQNVKKIKELESNQHDILHTGQDRMAYVVHLLAAAGEKFDIQHDPSVLTKPAYIIRSPQHVRASTSWKIIVRLRHLLDSVPKSWLQEQDKLVMANNFVIDDNVKEKVISVFSRWRSWELTNIAESYFFRHAMVETSLKESLISATTNLYLDIENIGFRIQYSDEEDFLCFDYLNIMFGWHKETRGAPGGSLVVDAVDVVKADSSVSCSNIRTRISQNLLDVYDSVADLGLLNAAPSTAKTRENVVRQQNKQSRFPTVDFNIAIRLKEISGLLDFPSLFGRLDCSDIRFCFLFNQVDRTKTNVVSSSVLTMHQLRSGLYWKDVNRSKSVGTTTVNDVKLTLVFSGELSTCSKFINVDSGETRVSLDQDLVKLAKMGIAFIENDFKRFEKYLQEPNTKQELLTIPDQPVKKRGAPLYIGPIYLKVHSSSVKSDVVLLPSYSFSYYCGDTKLFVRQVDATSFCSEIDVQKQKLDILTLLKDRPQRVVSLFFSNIESLSRIELSEGEVSSLNVVELLLNFGQIDFTIEPAAGELIKTGFKSLINEVGMVSEKCAELKELSKCEKTAAKQQLSSEQKIDTKNLANVNIIVERAVLMTSFGECSMAFDTKNLSFRFSSFSLAENGTITPKAKFGGIFTDSFTLVLISKELDKRASPIISGQTTITFQEAGDDSNGKDRLELSSDFIHVLLSPKSIELLFKIGDSLKIQHSMVQEKQPGEGTLRRYSQGGGQLEEPPNYGATLKRLTERTFAILSLNNVSIGWLFESTSSDDPIPGVLFGYEKFQITTADFKAKTTLSGVYLTPAVENDVFFIDPENTDVLNRPNTAYLPNISLTVLYSFTTPFPSLNMRLTGDSLRITCIPTIVNVVSKAVMSIGNTANALNNLVTNSPAPKKGVPSSKEAATSSEGSEEPQFGGGLDKRFRLPFSFRLDVEFEASIINLWSEVDFYHMTTTTSDAAHNSSLRNEMVPALFLQTPSVRAEVGYRLVEDATMPDLFNMEMLVSSSNNTIHPKFVPVAVEMWNTVKVMMKKQQLRAKKVPASQVKQSSSAEPSNDPYMYAREGSRLLHNLDVNIGVRFMRQEITLTCVPTAKVAATVSYDLLYLGLNTCGDANRGKFLSLSSRLHNLKTSLQHIYSREVSGYASIQNIMVVAAKNYGSVNELDPVMVAGKVADIMLDINMKQMQDLELFMDIWRPSGVLPTPVNEEFSNQEWPSTATSADENEGAIMYKYRRATTTLAIPWSVSIGIMNVHGVADMGQSVGKLLFELNKFWLSSQKSSNWEQNMMLGFDKVSLRSEGRLGGGVVIRRFHMRTAIMWEDVEDTGILSETYPVPLVQAVAGLDSVESKVSLDYHMFAILYLKGLQLSMSNQRDKKRVHGDRLLAVANCDVLDIYFTGLAASHFLDIYYTIMRMRSESNASYNAILKDSSTAAGTKDEAKSKKNDSTLGNVMANLTTVLDMRLGSLNCYVFPNSLTDTVVFVGAISGANAQYIQGQKDGMLESDLKMKMNEFVVALSNMRKTFPAEDINQITVSDYVIYAAEAAKGGTIISVPVCDIDMDTWQEFGKSIIEYTFDSSFGGRIDVGWNLGSINFIRDMWNAHAKAFAARKETYAMRFSSRRLSTMTIDEELKEVKLDSAYSYIPREPPIIAAPQLRDMGDATPPIEWIGLHRQRFPGLTHQVVILPLQSLVHEFGKFPFHNLFNTLLTFF
ncbi:hypothetical protein TRICI_000795 [Trichomonascus ciferrii]|uniref:Uncharacterized protein n=1 Tax=Trichomonascus ciferrii TaxID=44093 RepID=A0A642VBM4_9ASCO|nr:hypothetical protein TRICI_000795 [Trichomonascus ciferrii]